jgi:hypothetical protein
MTNNIELRENATIIPFKSNVWHYGFSKDGGMSETGRELVPMVNLQLDPEDDGEAYLVMDAQEVKELYRALKRGLKQAKKMAPLPDDKD